jgi:carnitine 3-dehydrogenase
LVDLVASQSDDQSSQWSIRELERIRDDNLVGIMEALARAEKGKGWGAGELHNAYVKQLGKASKAKVSKAAEKAKATKPKKVGSAKAKKK